jgi:hypothetical protein
VRESKTGGGTPPLPAGEDADATIRRQGNEISVRVSGCARGEPCICISLEGKRNPVSICGTNNFRDMDFVIQRVKFFPPDGRLFSGGFCCWPGALL